MNLAAIISLSCGAILDLGICRYAGKGQNESGMLRQLWGLFRSGDVIVADRLMCSCTEMVMLQQRGVDVVCRLTSHRTADFRRGERLGKDDHVVIWMKPRKPRSIEQEVYDALPEFLLVRECRVRIEQTGFRVRSLVIATTLLDAEEYTKDDLAQLYRARWNIELFFRWLKCVLGARHLLAQNRNGGTMQMYAALIVSLLIVLRTGRKPTKRTFETIQFHLLGWVSDEEFEAHLAALTAAKKDEMKF
jgi:Transposase DDE domain